MLLYRTPNIVIDRHEWHATVRLDHGRVSLVYRWRPLSARNFAWEPMTKWKGPKPKGMCDAFWGFRVDIRRAMQSEQTRREAVASLRGPESAAAVLNAGTAPSRRGNRARALVAARAA